LDGSDELPCASSKFFYRKIILQFGFSSGVAESLNAGNMDSNNRLTSKRQQWRGVLIAGFLLIILAVFVLFMVYFIFRRFINPSVPLNNGERKNYASIFNFRMFIFSSSSIKMNICFSKKSIDNQSSHSK
jgi:hypothetical protein